MFGRNMGFEKLFKQLFVFGMVDNVGAGFLKGS
jgi:hypothetical protein